MIISLSFSLPTDGPPVLAATLVDLVELVMQYPLTAISIAGACGILIGWLSRRCGVEEARQSNEVIDETRELRWRHEKLVLVERQQVEKQTRLDAFIERLASRSDAGAALSLLTFALAERIREARQKVGTDLARMKAIRNRLDEITVPVERGKEVVGMSRGMADSQVARLEEAREALREISAASRRIEDSAEDCAGDVEKIGELRRDVVTLKTRILDLPPGWATSADEMDGRLRELLSTIKAPQLAPVREILLVDGALTASLSGTAVIDLPSAAASVISVLDRLIDKRKADAKAGENESAAQANAKSHTQPDLELELKALTDEAPEWLLDSNPDFSTWQSSEDKEDRPIRIGQWIDEDRPGREFDGVALSGPSWEIDAPAPPQTNGFLKPHGHANGKAHSEDDSVSKELGKGNNLLAGLGIGTIGTEAAEVSPREVSDEDSDRSLVLFCSNKVELWGKEIYRGARCRARAIREFPSWANWISIGRLDTGERVFAPIRSASLRSGHSLDAFGFNGSNELFYGARHLGLFCETVPNEVETRFTYGGWGFGHRSRDIAPEIEELQAAGWEGREIPADTVFEIVIHEELPKLGSLDRLIDDEVRGSR